MLTLRAIDRDGLEAAAELLTKGFPLRTRAFWQRGLKRLADYNRLVGTTSPGNFLVAGETPVGILLTIAKRDPLTGRKVVNLSSWYVEEAHRWSAPRLLMAAMADRNAVYTDLTPTRSAAAMNARLGFRTIDYRLVVLFLPWMALAGRGRARLVPLDSVPSGALSDAFLRDLRNHRALGCIVTTVETEGRYHPVVFDVIPRKRIPAARVVYAERRDIVTENLAPLARMLVMRGVPLLTLQVGEDEAVPHSWVWERGLCHQVKGEWDDRVIDELYSERVLLKV